MSLEILYEQGNEIVSPFFDAVTGVQSSFRSTPTSLAVGAGSPFSDHVQQEPVTVTATIEVSNFPIVAPPGAEASRATLDLGPFRERELVEGGKVKRSGQVTAARFETRSRSYKASVTRYNGGAALTRAQDMLTELRRLKDGAVDLTVTTDTLALDSVVLHSIEIDENPSTGGKLVADLSFQQIQVAESEVIEDATPLEGRAERNRRRDRQAAEEVEEGADRNSVLSLLTGSGLSLGGG